MKNCNDRLLIKLGQRNLKQKEDCPVFFIETSHDCRLVYLSKVISTW